MTAEAPLIKDILNGTLNSRIESSQFGAAFDDTRLTDAEVAAGVTPVNYAYAPGNVLRYGAFNKVDTGDATTLIDSSPAVRLALLANQRIYFPPGVYYMLSTIIIAGEVVVITGEHGGTLSALSSRIVYDGTGPLFSATGTELGGIYIGHLQISGGSGDGNPCILSGRAQSVFERLHMETYDNPGIKLSTTLQGSWGTCIQECKWACPATPNAYIGYDLTINGGDVTVEECTAVNGSIALDIKQGQCITIRGCDFNKQNQNTSTDSKSVGQAAIRLSGSVVGATRFKPAINIDGNYLEGCTTAVYIESGESVHIANNYIYDVGASLGLTDTRGVVIVNGDGQNVSIENNSIELNGGTTCYGISNNSSNKVVIRNNNINIWGSGTNYWLNATARADIGYNEIIAGTLNDPSNLTFNIEPSIGSCTLLIGGSTTAGTQTYSANTAYYEQFGRTVTYSALITLTAKDAATAGNLQVTGFQHTVRNNAATGRVYSAAIGEWGNITLSAATKTQLVGTMANNGTVMTLFECGSGIASAALTAAALGATSTLRFTVTFDI